MFWLNGRDLRRPLFLLQFFLFLVKNKKGLFYVILFERKALNDVQAFGMR